MRHLNLSIVLILLCFGIFFLGVSIFLFVDIFVEQGWAILMGPLYIALSLTVGCIMLFRGISLLRRFNKEKTERNERSMNE